MPFSNSQLYSKAISTFILPLTSSYCLNTTLQTLSPFDTLFDQKTNPFIHQCITDPSFTLFSTLLFLPLLFGYITDRILVFSTLRWLGCTYILGGGFFISALITSNMWISIVTVLLFGFSLNMACVIAYVFICEYMFRINDFLDKFTKTLSACFALAVWTSAIFSFMDLKHNITIISVSVVLLILAVCASFYLSENDVFLRVLTQLPTSSARSSLILRKSIIFNEESSSENEDLLFPQDMNLHTHISEKSFLSIKLMGTKGFIIIMTLGALIGMIIQEKQFNSTLSDTRAIQYILFGLAGLFVACGKWQKKTLEKGIIGAVIVYLVAGIFLEMGIKGVQSVAFFVIQSIAVGSALAMCLVYMPYLVGFRVRLMGKTVGLFGWFVVLAQLLLKVYSEAKFKSVTLDTLIIGCVMLLCLVFTGITMKSWGVKAGKSSLISQINM